MSFYEEYLAKDKSLRHYSQHLLLALLTFFILSLVYGRIYLDLLLLYLIFSYIEDLDGLFTLIFKRKRYSEVYSKVKEKVKVLDIKGLAETFTKEHKKIDRLTLHNFVFYLLLVITFGISIYLGWILVIYILAAVLTHMTFDWMDDIYQVKNVNNWLWPFNILKKI